MDELLDWIGQRLGLQWVSREALPTPAPEPVAPPPQRVPPAINYLRALDRQAELGFPRGILAKLDEIEQLDPRHGEFVAVMRQLAGRFQFEAMREILRKSMEENHDSS